MTFADWLERSHLPVGLVADRLKVSEFAVHSWLLGKVPARKNQISVAILTRGMVRWEDRGRAP